MVAEKLGKPQTVPCTASAVLISEAEREFSAFLSAAAQVSGPHSVAKAAEHWLQAFDGMHLPRKASSECFRGITVSAVISLSQ